MSGNNNGDPVKRVEITIRIKLNTRRLLKAQAALQEKSIGEIIDGIVKLLIGDPNQNDLFMDVKDIYKVETGSEDG